MLVEFSKARSDKLKIFKFKLSQFVAQTYYEATDMKHYFVFHIKTLC